MKRLTIVSIFFVIILLFSVEVCNAGYIKGIETDPEDIKPGGSFSVIVELRATSWAKTIRFYLDGNEFDSKNVAGDDKSVESSEWRMRDRPLECGTHELMIEVLRRTGEIVDNETVKIDIGDIPVVTFNPIQPNPNKLITIKFTDKETGNPIKNADVEITRLRDTEWKGFSGETNADGEVSFITDEFGEYRLEMIGKEHCITKNFWVKKSMIVDGPHPEYPIIGSLISLAVPSGVGVKIADSTGKIVKTASTSITGGVNFTIEKPGNYTVIIGEISNEFWGKNLTLTVYDKLTPIIDVKPERIVVGSPVYIRITANEEPISGIDVKVKKPTGEESIYITDGNGTAIFTPLVVGEYIIRVEREDLRTVTRSINALNMLYVDILTKNITIDKHIELVVRDQNNVLVDKASVSIEGTNISGLTDENGRFKFNLRDVGRYNITVTKENSWKTKKGVDVLGYLFINLSSDEIEINDTVKISVFDINGNEIMASLYALKEDKTRERILDNIYTPKDVGVYKIIASKDMYINASRILTVNPHGIDITTNVSDKELLIRITSNGKPVKGMNIFLETSNGTENLTTDDNGIARYKIKKDEVVTINANLFNNIREYETKTMSVKIFKQYDYILLISLIVIILILTAISIIILHTVHGRVEKSGREKRDLLGRKKGRTRLSRV